MRFYDRNGNPCCYSDDLVHIYSYGGEPLGYIHNGRVWNYKGRYLGLFRNNWIIDRDGYYLFYTEDSIGGPLKPLRKLAPLKALRKLRPLKSLRELPPLRPLSHLSWSKREMNAFFGGD